MPMPEPASKPTSSAAAPTPSSTPPGGTSTSETPPAPVGTATPPSAKEFRFPTTDEVDPWARGKTAEEVLAIARGYHSAFDRGTVPAAPASAAPIQPLNLN